MTSTSPLFAMARAMVELQCQSNTAAKPDWMENPPPYLRAAVMESIEAIEHLGNWKWWKHQDPDMGQARMEIIDISLFYWSDIILKHQCNLDNAAKSIEQAVANYTADINYAVTFDGVDYQLKDIDLNRKLELLAGLAVSRRTDMTLLLSIMDDLGITFDDLYKSYIGKSALHCFRIDNGYKDGSYIKIWSGREDNEYLTDIINRSPLDGELYSTVLAGLASDYAQFAK